MGRTVLGVCLSLAGAAIGAAVGIALAAWLRRQGFYTVILPGALLGLGANLSSPSRSTVRGVIFGIAGLLVGVGAEYWLFRPRADMPLSIFLSEFSGQPPVTFLMIGIGALMAFWWGREPSPWARPAMRKVQAVEVQRGVERQDG